MLFLGFMPYFHETDLHAADVPVSLKFFIGNVLEGKTQNSVFFISVLVYWSLIVTFLEFSSWNFLKKLKKILADENDLDNIQILIIFLKCVCRTESAHHLISKQAPGSFILRQSSDDWDKMFLTVLCVNRKLLDFNIVYKNSGWIITGVFGVC